MILESQSNAREIFERNCLGRFSKALASGDWVVQRAAANNLGVLLHSLGRKEEARALFARALDVFEAQLDGSHPHVQMARRNLDSARAATG